MKPNAQHKALQKKIFQNKIEKPQKGKGSFKREKRVHKEPSLFVL
jgi:stalled ribosome alternative rescue factor ArfA